MIFTDSTHYTSRERNFMKRLVSGIMLTLLVVSMLTSLSVIQPVHSLTASLASSTEWKSPTATGKYYSDWDTPGNAYSSNNQYAVANSWYEAQDWYNFGLNIPSGSAIDGIEIKLEGTGDGIDYVGKVKCRVFRDHMTSYETDYLEFPATEDAFHIVGGPSDLWGLPWAPENFEDDAALPFVVRLTTGADWHTCRLDDIQVRVHYTCANQPPNQPSNISPANGATDVVLRPPLRSSDFFDPDSDGHAASQWQITKIPGDYSSPVFDSGTDTTHLTQIRAPLITSESYGVTYYWRVKYQDSLGAWSYWSIETHFTICSSNPPNNPPDQPYNISPSNGATEVELRPTLQASVFHDPDPYDIHAWSQWQVTLTSGDYSNPVVDSQVQEFHLTQYPFAIDLEYHVTYYWRVRYVDSRYYPGSATSVWSVETQFTTISGSAVQHRLTVSSAHDSPSPPNGDNYRDDGTSVTCSVTSPVTEGGVVYTCTGWTGTGSVQSSGTGKTVTFTITQASSITWNWIVAPASCGWPVLVAPVQISSNGGYSVGDTLTARFTIQNRGTAAIYLDKLLFGGRFNYGGTLPGGGFPDFSYSSVTLQVGQTLYPQYEGTLYLTEAGHYEFFVAYYIANPTEAEKQLLHLDPSNWNTCIDLAPGLTDSDRTWDRSISGSAPAPQTIPIAGKGIWIYTIWLYGSPDTIIARLESAKVKWVAIKCGDSNSYYLRPGGQLANWADNYGGFPQIISKFHQKGIKVLGTHFARSYNKWTDLPGATELDVANNILSISGIDGLLINAENDTMQAAIDNYGTYITGLRNTHPNDFIAYNSYDSAPPAWTLRVALHSTFTTYCDASMPEVYWTVSGRTPTQALSYMESLNGIGKLVQGKFVDRWHGKPIMPMGISGPAPDLGSREIFAGELKEFCDTSFAHGYSVVSLYAYHIMHSDPNECKVPQVWKWTEYSGCFNPDTTIRGQCPIELVVTDPDGLMISKTLNEVPGALYTELDPNGNNDTVIEVSIIHKKLGDYFLTVIRQPNASSNATYSLDFSTLNMTTTLAQNMSISDIPSESYAVTLTETAIVPRTEAHDIGIDRFSALKTFIGQDQVASLDVKVRNYGDGVEHFNLTLYLNLSIIANFENITLASRDSFLTTFKWNTTGLPRGSYTINAVCSCVEGESYTDDNLKSFSMEITILGDVNGDGKVRIDDVLAVAQRFGTDHGGPPNSNGYYYDANCDVNDDLKIRVDDVLAAAQHFGQGP